MAELRRLRARHPLTLTREGKVVEIYTSVTFLEIFQFLDGVDKWPDVWQPQIKLGR